MSPQLTLQSPLSLPPNEIPSYLGQLWTDDQPGNTGANTFCLLVWQPSWVEQQLARAGKIKGAITGTQRQELIQAARQLILDVGLPHSTSPIDNIVSDALKSIKQNVQVEDLRGQYIHSAISALQPRRLITLAPTIDDVDKLEALVAAYCPLIDEGGGESTCGDVVVLRGKSTAINKNLDILDQLLPSELPSWVWWNGSLDEETDLLQTIAIPTRRIIFDSTLGEPRKCLDLLKTKISAGHPVNDLNWLRLRTWRETLAMVFDPPHRRNALNHIAQIDLDIEGENPVQGLLLTAWIADRLGWELQSGGIDKDRTMKALFKRSDGNPVHLRIVPLPVGNPSIHPGQIIGLRLICEPNNDSNQSICVILASESGECMRLEAGGMASMELHEEVVPVHQSFVEMDVARLLASSRGSTSPLLEAASPLAAKILELFKTNK